MKRFEISFLDSYTKEEILEEIRRVASLLADGPLTKKKFKELSGRVEATTIRRRFPGGWKEALENAGVGHLYGGGVISIKMKTQEARNMTDGALLEELKQVHSLMGTETLTKEGFDQNSTVTSYATIRSRFGGWEKALEEAGIPLSNHARRYTDEECFENLVTVWSHYGRTPKYLEMKKSPSVVGPKAYVRWGTWRKALRAFVDWVDSEAKNTTSEIPQPSPKHVAVEPESRKPEDNREVRPGLRFKVFQRDRFRCVSCGRSPATHLNVELHADHIISIVDGGKTTFENLQTLCIPCNLGKGRLSVHIKETVEKSEI